MITPVQAICFAERCALLSGSGTDFVMNIFAPWTGVRWGELMAVEGSADKDSPLKLPDAGRRAYELDWQLREIKGKVWQGTAERRVVPDSRHSAVPSELAALGGREPP